MLTVWKFELNHRGGDLARVEMPQGADVLSAGYQGSPVDGQFMIWAKVDPNAPKCQRMFTVHGTGHNANDTDGAAFVDTVFLGPLVFHVFDLGEEQ